MEHATYGALPLESRTAEATGKATKIADEGPKPVQFLDEITGRPHARRPYRLELRDGRVFAGTTNAYGCTRPLSAAEREAVIRSDVTPDFVAA
jgi:hypothetical protein